MGEMFSSSPCVLSIPGILDQSGDKAAPETRTPHGRPLFPLVRFGSLGYHRNFIHSVSLSPLASKKDLEVSRYGSREVWDLGGRQLRSGRIVR